MKVARDPAWRGRTRDVRRELVAWEFDNPPEWRVEESEGIFESDERQR